MEEFSESLLEWVQTFDIEAPHGSISDLCDGVALAQLLNGIDSAFFDEEWLAKIKTEEVSNWRLKMSNLRKILQRIREYYSDFVGVSIRDFQMPDLQLVAEHSDQIEMGRLLQLVLGCAVNCEQKQTHIEQIMGLEESVQHGVMTAIQDLMSRESAAESEDLDSADGIQGDPTIQMKQLTQELSKHKTENLDLLARCQQLDSQVASLLEEKAGWESDADVHSSRQSQGGGEDDEEAGASGKKLQSVQQQLEQLKDETYRLEAERNDYKGKLDMTARDLGECRQKLEEMSGSSETLRSLQDEVDALRGFEAKAIKYESTIEVYKSKLEEMGDLKRQMKLLEEKNRENLALGMEREDEAKKASALKSQLEILKRQVTEVQLEMSEEVKRADKAEFEYARGQEKIEALSLERDRLSKERDRLKEGSDELQFSQLQGSSTAAMLFGGGSDDDDFDLSGLPLAVQERFARLQHELKTLRESQQQQGQGSMEGGGASELLLESANKRARDAEAEIRAANQKLMTLGARVNDLEETSERERKDGSEANEDLRSKLKEMLSRQASLETELRKKRDHCSGQERRIGELEQLLTEEGEARAAKEEALVSMEDKYKKYLDKARTVIKSLDPSKTGISPEVELLKQQLSEKEKRIHHIQREYETIKHSRTEEEHLMVTAWYNLGMQAHRKAVDSRLHQYSVSGQSQAGQGQSFLARQRQQQQRKRPIHPVPASAK